MANNRMYLVNRKTGAKIYLAKYYPSTGWYSGEGLTERLNDGFNKSDFGHLTPEDQVAKDAQPEFGAPYANYDKAHLMWGDQWEIEYEITSSTNAQEDRK